jgi:hypothetical protein
MACTSMASSMASSGPLDPAARQVLFDRIDRAIEPFDALGLRDRTRLDWFPALASDLVASASKLEASVEEVRRLLERSGFGSAAGRAVEKVHQAAVE